MADGMTTTTRRDADHVRRALEPWLAARLPGQQVENLQVAAPEGHGFSNDTLIADVTVDGVPMPLVCQAAPTGPGLFPEYPIARMANVQRGLRDHSDVPVANVRWLEEDAAILGAPFYVMDKLEGLVPDESPVPYPVSGWVHEATADQRRTMWTSLIEAMAKLARLDVAEHFPFLTATRWGMSLDADAAPERVRQWRAFTIWASEDDTSLPPTLMRAWDVLAASTPPRPERLSINWGDAKLGNVMFRDFHVVALFDWELCGVGPAEEDITNLLALDQVFANLCRVPRSEGFLSRDETLGMYSERIGRELIGTDWWYTFALAKMAAEVHRMQLQSRKLTGEGADIDLESVNIALPVLREALAAL